MLNVNGVNVRIVSSPAKRVAKGWLHSTAVYSEGGAYIGVVERITSRKTGDGGRVSDGWARLGSFRDGVTLPHGNLNDLVARWRERPAPALSGERGVCPSCHAETRPGEQLYADGSCWPQCLAVPADAKDHPARGFAPRGERRFPSAEVMAEGRRAEEERTRVKPLPPLPPYEALCGRCGKPGAAGAAGLCASCDSITDPPLLLMVNGSIISGARDALVTLRSAIDEALGKGRGRADVEDEEGDEFHVTVERVGP